MYTYFWNICMKQRFTLYNFETIAFDCSMKLSFLLFNKLFQFPHNFVVCLRQTSKIWLIYTAHSFKHLSLYFGFTHVLYIHKPSFVFSLYLYAIFKNHIYTLTQSDIAIRLGFLLFWNDIFQSYVYIQVIEKFISHSYNWNIIKVANYYHWIPERYIINDVAIKKNWSCYGVMVKTIKFYTFPNTFL